jgi:hypothetical protein
MKDPELNHTICTIVMMFTKSRTQLQALVQRKVTVALFECLKQTWEKRDSALMEATSSLILQAIIRIGKYGRVYLFICLVIYPFVKIFNLRTLVRPFTEPKDAKIPLFSR